MYLSCEMKKMMFFDCRGWRRRPADVFDWTCLPLTPAVREWVSKCVTFPTSSAMVY